MKPETAQGKQKKVQGSTNLIFACTDFHTCKMVLRAHSCMQNHMCRKQSLWVLVYIVNLHYYIVNFPYILPPFSSKKCSTQRIQLLQRYSQGKTCALLNSVQKFIEIQDWLLLTFFICLHNQLSSFNSITIQMSEKRDSSNRQ